MGDSLVLPTFVLILVYFMVFIIAIIRVVRIFRLTDDWRHTKLFYISVTIGVFLRGLFFIVLISWGSTIDKNWLFILLTLPECIFIAIYIELFWLMTSVYFYAHWTTEIHLAADNDISNRIWKSKNRLSMFIALSIVVWSFLQLLLYIFLLAGKMHTIELSYEISFMNIGTSLVFLSVIIYLSVKFSGSPFRAAEWGDRLKRAVCMMLTWIITRILNGIINLFGAFSSDTEVGFYSEFDSSSDETDYLIDVVFLIAWEILCYVLVLDQGFIRIFIRTQDARNTASMFRPTNNYSLGLDLQFDATASELLIVEKPEFRLDINQVQIYEQLPGAKLGELFKAQYKGKPMALRVIKLKTANAYLFEDFENEVQRIYEIQWPHLLPIVGTSLASPKINILMPYMEHGSLYNAIHDQQIEFQHFDKVRIATEVAKSMRELHAQEIYHGNLKSENILLNENWRVFISDLGFIKIRKRIALNSNYTNMTGWSSPEQLKAKSGTVTNPTDKDDVFSFGTILYEFFTNTIPFEGLPLNQIRQILVQQAVRPKLPEDLPEEITIMIQSCWNENPATRPTFNQIYKALQSDQPFSP